MSATHRAALACLLLPLALAGCFIPDADPPGQLESRPGIPAERRTADQPEAGNTVPNAGAQKNKSRNSSPNQAGKAGADDTRRALTGHWISATLRRVQDGDSLIVRGNDGLDYTLRLSGIDAPERSQPFANRARQHLQALTTGKPLSYLAAKRDQYGRLVVLLRAAPAENTARPHEKESHAQHTDVNRAMLDAGLAWYFRRYESDLPLEKRSPYRAAEAAARKARRGLWSEPGPQAPWDFRNQKREAQAARKKAHEQVQE